MRTKNILVVDDEPATIKLFLQSFKSEINSKYYQFHFATNGIGALAKFATNSTISKPIDLLITDINMPKVNGTDLINYIQENQPKLPIIVVTGYVNLLKLKGTIDRDNIELLNKPIKLQALKKVISRMLKTL